MQFKAGTPYYAWALLWNIANVVILLLSGGIFAFAASNASWLFVLLAAISFLFFWLSAKGQGNHRLIGLGVPLTVIVLVALEAYHGLSLHMLTIVFLVIARCLDFAAWRRSGR